MTGLTVRAGSLLTVATGVRFTESIRGAEVAQFDVDPFLRHPDLRAGERLTLSCMSHPVWAGRISETNDGDTIHAVGNATYGDNIAAIDGDGNPTRVPSTAFSWAWTRGATGWFSRNALSGTAWAPDNTDGEITLAALLDGWTKDAGARWHVDIGSEFTYHFDPTTPKWRVNVAGVRFSQAADTSAPTHLLVQFLAGVGDFQQTELALDADAPARREKVVNLTDRGFITESAALDIARNLYDMGGGRTAGLTETLTIGRGDATTMDGSPVDPLQVLPGDMIRVQGQPKESALTRGMPHLDVIVGERQFDADSWRSTLTPLGGKARTYFGVMAEMYAGLAR